MSIIRTEKSRGHVERAGPPPFMRPGSDDPMFMEQIKGLRAKLEHLIDAFNYRVVAALRW